MADALFYDPAGPLPIPYDPAQGDCRASPDRLNFHAAGGARRHDDYSVIDHVFVIARPILDQ